MKLIKKILYKILSFVDYFAHLESYVGHMESYEHYKEPEWLKKLNK